MQKSSYLLEHRFVHMKPNDIDYEHESVHTEDNALNTWADFRGVILADSQMAYTLRVPISHPLMQQ